MENVFKEYNNYQNYDYFISSPKADVSEGILEKTQIDDAKSLIVDGADRKEVAETLQLNDEDMENLIELIGDDKITEKFRQAIKNAIAEKKVKGLPVAMYDSEAKKAYLEYSDGRREYMIGSYFDD